jgi:hypothetical protein
MSLVVPSRSRLAFHFISRRPCSLTQNPQVEFTYEHHESLTITQKERREEKRREEKRI